LLTERPPKLMRSPRVRPRRIEVCGECRVKNSGALTPAFAKVLILPSIVAIGAGGSSAAIEPSALPRCMQ
jgi:hypothetical protein